MIVYIFILFIIYFYTFISHNNSISLKLISARSEFLYIPLSLIIIQALKWNKFSVLLFKLFIVVLVLNISVSLLQFFASQLIEGVPGISGLREEGVKLHTWRSFGEQEITTIFGLFSGNGKFTRNLFHILIWIWLLHFIFKIGKFRNLIILSVFIGPILVISGKRLPALMWMFFMLSIPLIMLVSRIVIDKIRVFDFKEFIFLKSVQYKVLALIFISFIFIVFLYGISEKAKLYVDLVSFVLTNEIEQRFFSENADYFWQAEINRVDKYTAIFGQGAGTSSIGANYLNGNFNNSTNNLISVEHGPIKVLVEFGLLGFIQMVLLWGLIFFVDIVVINSLKNNPRWKAASFVILLYHLLILASFFNAHSYWSDVQMQVHFWLITGVQFWLFITNSKKLNNNSLVKTS